MKNLKITFLVHPKSWITAEDAARFLPVLEKYASSNDITLTPEPCNQGDVLFALHYPALIPLHLFPLHKNNVVIHGANLPDGRGRSPIHWQIEQGADEIVLTLFEMCAGVDDGPVYLRSTISFEGYELLPEIRQKIIGAEIAMIDEFLSEWPMLSSPQVGEPFYFPKRNRENQRLDPNKTIAEQFDKMRVADNEQYPLWFEHRGVVFQLKINRYPISN